MDGEPIEGSFRSHQVPAADVIEAVAEDRGWNHRTIRTLLGRLVEKGALQYEVDGNRYLYRPALTRERCVRRESRTFAEKIFAGDIGSLLVHFVQEAEITPQEIQRLKEMLDNKPIKDMR